MNEQIKALISQVGTDSSGKWMSIDNVEKLAKLIVLECMSYMKDGDIDFAKFMIKRNFGVEE